MPSYEVTVRRVEQITYLVVADTPEDAAARALSDGDELRSDTEGQPETVSVEEVSA